MCSLGKSTHYMYMRTAVTSTVVWKDLKIVGKICTSQEAG